MTNEKKIEWILKIGVAGEFIGHGVFALQGKADWIKWTSQLSGMALSSSNRPHTRGICTNTFRLRREKGLVF